MDALLQVKQVSKHFGGFTALSEVSVDIAPGERFGLIGPNGSGKTTLINCISGLLRNESGKILFEQRTLRRLAPYQRTRLGIARSFQVPRPFHTMTVLENLLVPFAYVVHLKDAEGAGAGDGNPEGASASPTRRKPSPASCRRSSCASSSWRAPWRRSRAC